MFRSRRFLSEISGLVLLLAGQPIFAAPQGKDPNQEPGSITSIVQGEPGLLEWRFKGRKLLTYAFGSNQFKPYVRELFTLAGDNILRDSPTDHSHHHGLMYAVHVNDVNFWEEIDHPGHQRHLSLVDQSTGRNARGLPQAQFTELIHWVPPGDQDRPDTAPAALLVERRTLTLTVDEAQEAVGLTWHAEFEVGHRTPGVRLHGSDYNGLGLRLPAAWDRVAAHVNSEGRSARNGGRPASMPARWSAVSSSPSNRAPQVLVFADPRGHAGTNAFFTMTEPFTYLAATQSLDSAPLDYRSGDRFTLDYLVLACSSTRTPAEIEQRYQRWSRTLPTALHER